MTREEAIKKRRKRVYDMIRSCESITGNEMSKTLECSPETIRLDVIVINKQHNNPIKVTRGKGYTYILPKKPMSKNIEMCMPKPKMKEKVIENSRLVISAEIEGDQIVSVFVGFMKQKREIALKKKSISFDEYREMKERIEWLHEYCILFPIKSMESLKPYDNVEELPDHIPYTDEDFIIKVENVLKNKQEIETKDVRKTAIDMFSANTSYQQRLIEIWRKHAKNQTYISVNILPKRKGTVWTFLPKEYNKDLVFHRMKRPNDPNR